MAAVANVTVIVDDQKMHDLANEITASLQPISASRWVTFRFALTLMRCAIFDHAVSIDHGWVKCARCCWREKLPEEPHTYAP